MEADTGAAIFFLIFWCGFVLIGIFSFVIWVWMLIDCLSNEPACENDKLLWVIVMLFAGILGSILYYFIRRPERIRLHGR